MSEEKYNYDNIPILYCKHCLSLAIIGEPEDIPYCRDCGDIIIGSANIYVWEDMYLKKYGEPHLK